MNAPVNVRTPRPASSDIDFRAMVRTIWTKKWLIGAVSFAAAVVAVVVSLLLPDIYRSEALLAPSDPENNSGIAALASQYAGLASLAGINLEAGKTDKTALGLEILQSRRFITEFIEKHDALVPLIAADDWDASTRELKIDADDYDVDSREWVRTVWPPKSTIPSAHEAYEEFMEILEIEQDQATGFVTISIEHYSPVVARNWVAWLIDDLNQSIMQRDVSEAKQAIEFLNDQITSTSLANLQSVFSTLIEEHTRTVMLASVTDEYLLKVIDPPIEPEIKEKPKRALIVVLSAFLALLLATVFVLIFEPMRASDQE
jgi:uncharacterized protein involved in exopolysaccharide biosynthesis